MIYFCILSPALLQSIFKLKRGKGWWREKQMKYKRLGVLIIIYNTDDDWWSYNDDDDDTIVLITILGGALSMYQALVNPLYAVCHLIATKMLIDLYSGDLCFMDEIQNFREVKQ